MRTLTNAIEQGEDPAGVPLRPSHAAPLARRPSKGGHATATRPDRVARQHLPPALWITNGTSLNVMRMERSVRSAASTISATSATALSSRRGHLQGLHPRQRRTSSPQHRVERPVEADQSLTPSACSCSARREGAAHRALSLPDVASSGLASPTSCASYAACADAERIDVPTRLSRSSGTRARR